MKSLASSQSPRDKEVTKVERPPNSVNHPESKERASLGVNEFRNEKKTVRCRGVFEHYRLDANESVPPTPPPFCMNVKTRGLQNLHFVSG